MDIYLYTGQSNEPVLICYGIFKDKVSHILMDENTLELYMVFENGDHALLNCAVDPTTAQRIHAQPHCTLGLVEGQKFKQAYKAEFKTIDLRDDILPQAIQQKDEAAGRAGA